MKACLLALGGATLTSALRYGIPGVPVLGGDGENGPPVPATKELTARITKDWSKWDTSGDGKHDDTLAIQNAMCAAGAHTMAARQGSYAESSGAQSRQILFF